MILSEPKFRWIKCAFLQNVIPWGTVKPLKSCFFDHAKFLRRYEQPLASKSKGQKWYQKLRLRLQPKKLFKTIPNTLFDYTIH